MDRFVRLSSMDAAAEPPDGKPATDDNADLMHRLRVPAIATALYVALRLGLVFEAETPVVHPDTNTYLVTPDLLGRTWRPWVYPLVNAVLPDRGVIALQTVVSAVAFSALAFSIASTFESKTSKTLFVASLLTLGATTRNTLWDSMIMTESLGLALTALLIATLIHLDRIPPIAPLGLFMLWIFLRDAHLYLGALAVAGVAIWGIRKRRWTLPAGFAVILLWAALAGGNDSQAEDYAVRINAAYHVAADADTFDWFVAHGMPQSNAFTWTDLDPERPGYHLAPSPGPESRDEWDDAADQLRLRFLLLRADSDFQRWVEGEGARAYARFLIEHPGFTFGAMGRLFVNGDLYDEAFVDRTYLRLSDDEPAGVPGVIPDDGSAFSIILLVAGLVALGARTCSTRKIERRFILPIILLLSTVPHVLLAYHGSPWEIGRHGVILTFVLHLTSIWMIAIATDRRSPIDDEPDPAST